MHSLYRSFHLLQNLHRLSESDPDENAAIYNTLATIENLIEMKPAVAELVYEKTKLLKWLLGKIKVREFDGNKQYVSEILAILLQSSSVNQKKLGQMNGVDVVLQAVAMYKSKDPKSSDEEEMVENLFDCLCCLLMPLENKEKFVKAEGVELMIIIMKQKKLAYASAIRARKALPESSKGVHVILTAEKSYLSAPHHAELVERRWGGSTHITVEEVKKKIADLLREYVDSGETLEACRCIRELGVAFFHHEVVKKALVLAMENPSSELLLLKLLKEAAEEGLISSSQMVKGFSRLAEGLDDLALDIPSAKALFQSFVPKAISEGWLDASFTNPAGENGEFQVEDEKVRKY